MTRGIWFGGEGISGGVAYARLDFVEDMPSLPSLFLELARLTTAWLGLQLLPWNKSQLFVSNLLAGTLSGRYL